MPRRLRGQLHRVHRHLTHASMPLLSASQSLRYCTASAQWSSTSLVLGGSRRGVHRIHAPCGLPLWSRRPAMRETDRARARPRRSRRPSWVRLTTPRSLEESLLLPPRMLHAAQGDQQMIRTESPNVVFDEGPRRVVAHRALGVSMRRSQLVEDAPEPLVGLVLGAVGVG